MVLLSSIRRKTPHPWHELTSLKELDELVANSFHHPVVVFKHSVRCSISGVVRNRFKREWDFDGNDVELWHLDLLQFRSLSNAIAERFGVIHESPQILLIENGTATFHASHNAVRVSSIKEQLTG